MKRPSLRPGYWGAGFIAAITTSSLALAGPEAVQEGAVAGHYFNYAHHGFSHGPLTMILAVVVIVFVVLFAIHMCGKRCHRHRHSHSDSLGIVEKSALDMLKVRFACGEIDEAEYKARKKVLEEE